MITLNISSTTNIDEKELLNIFLKLKIGCQILKSKSSIKCINNTFTIEDGYKIYIFDDIGGAEFKETIWTDLKKLMLIDCAFIQYKNEYMGCILNWPGVFTPSNCTICEC
jgi:hypothetical protein